jgi:hypothetical protein
MNSHMNQIQQAATGINSLNPTFQNIQAYDELNSNENVWCSALKPQTKVL